MRVGKREPAGRGARQRGQMRAAAERRADVFSERADVGALAAVHAQPHIGRAPIQQGKSMDLDRARMTGDLHALARVLVVFAPVALERGMARRHLRDAAHKARQHRLDVIPGRAHRVRGDDLALGVAGGRRHAEAQHRVVGLVRIEQHCANLVASPKQIGNSPVASGSSVPVWPALSA